MREEKNIYGPLEPIRPFKRRVQAETKPIYCVFLWVQPNRKPSNFQTPQIFREKSFRLYYRRVKLRKSNISRERVCAKKVHNRAS